MSARGGDFQHQERVLRAEITIAAPAERAWAAWSDPEKLKAFPVGPGERALAIRGCGWDLEPARAAAIEQQMSEALGRLEQALLE